MPIYSHHELMGFAWRAWGLCHVMRYFFVVLVTLLCMFHGYILFMFLVHVASTAYWADFFSA